MSMISLHFDAAIEDLEVAVFRTCLFVNKQCFQDLFIVVCVEQTVFSICSQWTQTWTKFCHSEQTTVNKVVFGPCSGQPKSEWDSWISLFPSKTTTSALWRVLRASVCSSRQSSVVWLWEPTKWRNIAIDYYSYSIRKSFFCRLIASNGGVRSWRTNAFLVIYHVLGRRAKTLVSFHNFLDRV